jgi:hypothetical protein
VTEGAAEWQANQRDDSYLFRGARLAEAEAWITDHGGDLTSTEWAFLSTSLAERDRLATDAEERRQQELAQQRLLAEEQRQRAEDQTKAAARLRRRAWIASGIGLIAMIAAIVAVIFFLNARRNEQRAEAERVQAESKALAFAAIAQLTQDPELALLLARQAMTVADTVEAQEAMHQALQATRVEAAFNTGDEIVEAVFDQSGQRLAAFTRDDVLKVWQAPYGSDPITTIASNERIVSLAFNPDGQQLATGTEEGLVTIWNVTTGEQVKSLSGLTKWVMALAFSTTASFLW